jgi:carbonic anhydrase
MSKFSDYEYRKQPGSEMNTFEGVNQAIPMKTLVIYCFAPRAAEIPQAVVEYFGDDVYPAENILDESGNRVDHIRTLFTQTNAGGRAAFALKSVAAMDYIFSVQNVVVVHHSFCGTTTLTPELLIEEFHDHHHADISTIFDHDSLAIADFEKSVQYDIELLRSSPAVPKHTRLYGFCYELSSGKLTEVVRDIPAWIECRGATVRCVSGAILPARVSYLVAGAPRSGPVKTQPFAVVPTNDRFGDIVPSI